MDNRFKAVVFDMDGVITDTEKLYRRFQYEEGTSRGISNDLMLNVCEAIAGGNKFTNKQKFEDLVGNGIDYFEYRACMLRRMDAYIAEHGVELKKNVKEILQYIKDKGMLIGLATSTKKEKAEKYLKAHDIYKYFDKLTFGDTISRGKPFPDIYLKACEKLGVNPKEAVAVEDSINGIKSAGAAGLYTVMVVDLIPPKEEIMPIAKNIYYDIIELKNIL